jgi:hypothetical protein
MAWPLNGSPGEPTRLTDSDLGNEDEAILSPTGEWVLVKANKNGDSSLYLVSYDSSATIRQVIDDGSYFNGLKFSTDGQYAGYVSVSKNLIGVARALAVSGSGDVTPTTISEGNDHVELVTWQPVQTGHRLVWTINSSESSGTFDIKARTFSDLTQLGSQESIFTSIPIQGASGLLATSQDIFAAINRQGASAPKVKKFSDVETETAEINVRSELVKLKDTAIGNQPWFDVLGAQLSQDGSSGFVLGRMWARCADEVADRFVTGISVFDLSGSSAVTWYVPRVSKDNKTEQGRDPLTFELAKSPCDLKNAGGTIHRIDGSIVAFAVNQDATPSNFRAFYVTRLSRYVDSECRSKIGDLEIMALEKTEARTQFFPVAQNQADLIDDVPASGSVCQL